MATKLVFALDSSWHRTLIFQPTTEFMRVVVRQSLFLVLLFVGPVMAASAQNDKVHNLAITLIQEEIGTFAGQFTDIEFVWLTGKEYSEDMLKLSAALGENHELLDYEHHAHQVEALNALNLDRIKMMLDYDSPSSSLYRVAQNKMHGKPYVVVLTLNPGVLTGEPSSSTCYMYNIDIDDYSNISERSRVENAAYLRYVVRHEIAHALKAYLFSGHAFTQKPSGGDYNSYLSEIWADMFAVMMELRFGSGDMDFIRNLVDARAVGLVTNFDIQHFTSPQMNNVLQAKQTGISNLRELAHLVQAEYLRIKPSYESYEVLAMTAYHLRHALKGSPYDTLTHDEIIAEYEVGLPHEGLLAQLVEEAETAMHRVFR